MLLYDRCCNVPTLTSVVLVRVVLMTMLATLCIALMNEDADTSSDRDGPMAEEYCNGETFRPRCDGGKNDVIIVLSARYGRMNFGRCLKKEPVFASIMDDPRFLGCSADVKDVIDRHCSGQSECDVRINDQNFDGVKPCYAGLKMHMEASYACVRVAAESRHCTVSLAAESQHIVGRSRQSQSDAAGCGTEAQPWMIEAMAGQRIAVSLIDFKTSSNDSTPVTSCHPKYGHIIDRTIRRNVSICEGQNLTARRDKTENEPTIIIYVSSSNQLQIILNDGIQNKFLIRVEAVGCSDLAPPSDAAWLKRVDDQITVGCYMSRQSWQLNCVNGVWTGTVGICNQLIDNANSDDESFQTKARSSETRNSTEMMALAAVASAGVAVCCLVICIGIVCLRRQRKSADKKLKPEYRWKDAENVNEHHQLNAGYVVNAVPINSDGSHA